MRNYLRRYVYLWIRHEDGTYACYFHLRHNGAIAKYGDKVHRRDLIAEVGNTGTSSEPHLHFGQMSCASCPSVFPNPPDGTHYPDTSQKLRFRLKVFDRWTGGASRKTATSLVTGTYCSNRLIENNGWSGLLLTEPYTLKLQVFQYLRFPPLVGADRQFSLPGSDMLLRDAPQLIHRGTRLRPATGNGFQRS